MSLGARVSWAGSVNSLKGSQVALSRHAWKTSDLQGTFVASEIVGDWPSQISGKWTKIGPGRKQNQGTPLNHFFDGDAYITDFVFSNVGVSFSTHFLQTPFVVSEQKESKMLYHEFGTAAAGRGKKQRKNQTNINVIPWSGQMMALSEGGHPSLLDGDTKAFTEWNNFNGTLPKNVSFGAHPKVNQSTGRGFGFGFNQGISRSIKLFTMDSRTNQLFEILDLPQNHVPMIHDMIETENYIIIVVSSAYFKLLDLIMGKNPLSEALYFDSKMPGNAIVYNKNQMSPPIQIKLPPLLCFHHAGAIEEANGLVSLYTFKTDDGSLLQSLSDWQSTKPKKANAPNLCKIVIDLNHKKFISETKIASAHDFPVGRGVANFSDTGILWASRMGRSLDPLAFDGFSRIQVKSGQIDTVEFEPDETAGEVVIIPNENQDYGWIGLLGYNRTRDESYIELRDEKSLGFVSRAWLGHPLPLGFHGHFSK